MTCFGGHSVQYNSIQSYSHKRVCQQYSLWKFRLINASIQQHCSCTAIDEVWVSCCRTVISESTTEVWKRHRILYRSGRYAQVKSAPKCIISTQKIKKISGEGAQPHWGGAPLPRPYLSAPAARPRRLRRLDPIPPTQKSCVRPWSQRIVLVYDVLRL